MSRPKEFDVDQALERALGVFWQQGYEATSMQDLVDAMGIQRASLYGTFGDKHALYVQALRRYQERGVADLERRLATGSPRRALVAMLRDLGATAGSRSGRKGCFCVNAGVEAATGDRALGKLIREHGQCVEALLADAVRRAQQLGEVAAEASPEATATLLFGLIVAINVLGKQSSSEERVQRLVDHGIAALA